MKTNINIIWFKRDLRLRDHLPLQWACTDSVPILLLYILEPALMAQPDSDARHWRFVYQSIEELNRQLAPYKQRVWIWYGSAEAAFSWLHRHCAIQQVFSHQEIGNAWTYARDRQMAQWFLQKGINWRQAPYSTVVRGRSNRRQWREEWQVVMDAPLFRCEPEQLGGTPLGPRLASKWLSINELPAYLSEQQQAFQPGGELTAWRYLRDFFTE
ncbi:MAG: deoxyribodipyrimidine photolyase, partial [Bacteroidetes bacterium]